MILGCEDSLNGKPFAFSFSDAAAKLAISRSHVRKLVADGQEAGLVEWRPDDRQLRLRAVFITELLQHHAIRFLLVAEALGHDERLSGMALVD
jgi:DNA-binding IclR family transcriptional regulator